MIAIVIAIRIVPKLVLKPVFNLVLKRVRSRRQSWPVRLITAPGGSGTDADGATVTMISANPAPMRRWKQQRQRTALRFANRARTRVLRRGNAFRARTGIRTATRANLAAAARRAGAKKVDVATNVPRAGRRTGNSQPARRRANATVRSTPIRRLPNWRRLGNSSPPARISANIRPRTGVAWSASVSTNGCGMRGS
jgi:hypothetical protein